MLTYRDQLTCVLAEIDGLLTRVRRDIYDPDDLAPNERIRAVKVLEDMEAVRETVEAKLRGERQ